MLTFDRLLGRGMIAVVLCGLTALARGDPLVIWTSDQRGIFATVPGYTETDNEQNFGPFRGYALLQDSGIAQVEQHSEILTSPDGFFVFIRGFAGSAEGYGPVAIGSTARVTFTLSEPSDYTVYANGYGASGVATECHVLFPHGSAPAIWSYADQTLPGGVSATSGTLLAGDYLFDVGGIALNNGSFYFAVWLLIPEPTALVALLLLVPALLRSGRR
ncbi:MAG: hypothetical protein SF069_15465 [Phycisphaerae bacterium]|nr:hypothetical protein [Phycisphaerae bacterium]